MMGKSDSASCRYFDHASCRRVEQEDKSAIRLFHKERGLTSSQIGRELGIDPETAAKYAALDT